MVEQGEKKDGIKTLSRCQQTYVVIMGVSKRSTLTKHDVVDRVSIQVLLVEARGEQLDVASATVDALLVFHSELDY